MFVLSNSLIHKFPTVFLFSGWTRSTNSGSFLFDETEEIFSRENLGSFVVEYETDEDIESFLKSNQYQNLLNETSRGFDKLTTFISLKIVDASDFDVSFEYVSARIPADTIAIYKQMYGSHLKIRASCVEVSELDSVLQMESLRRENALNLKISRKFFENGQTELSAKYTGMFSEAYSDLQVNMIVLPALISGTAPAKN